MRHFDFKTRPTDIFGLTAEPYFEKESDNDSDSLNFRGPYPIREVSLESYNYVYDWVKVWKPQTIVEIGVFQNIRGFTHALTSAKSSEAIYVGIDRDDKRYLGSPVDNIHMIMSDSAAQDYVRSQIRSFGATPIDLLFIDGFHSLRMVLNDFRYADMLSEKGVIFMHDTNFHPGPNIVFRYVDENIFEKELLFVDHNDYGLGILRKK